MRLPVFFLLVTSLFYTEFVIADSAYFKREVGDYIGLSCTYSLSKTATFCESKSDKKTCLCKNAPNLGSMLYCGYDQADNEKEKEAFNKWYLKSCPKLTETELEAAYENATSYLVSTSDISGFNKSTAVFVPVKYNKKKYSYALTSYQLRYHNQDDAYAMGAGLVAYWGVIILIGIANNIIEKLFPRQHLILSKRISNNALVKLYRKHIILPATFQQRHTEPNYIRGYIPTRIQSIIIFGFTVLAIVFSAVRYHGYEHNVIWTETRIQISRYVSVRTGIMACFLLPLMYLFAGRNNFLLWLTGWKQSTFYTYHKWICRIDVLLSVTHSIAFLCNTVWMGKYEKRKATYWYKWGIVAIVLMSSMVIFSLGFIRHYNYELFLNFHILCAVFVTIGIWKHIQKYNNLQYLYATVALWGFDRAARIFRLFSFGLRSASVEIVSNEILRLTVSKPSFWRTYSGAFGYIYFMESSCFWQSHPFTIVQNGTNEINAYIKIKKGVTETIYKRLLEKPNMRDTLKISIEGPYGDHKNLAVYDNVLMFTSSNGIPSTFTYARELSQKQTASGKKTFIKFYWIIRHWHSLDWFVDELKELANFENVVPIVYVTKYSDAKVGTKFLNPSSDASSSNSSLGEKPSESESVDSSIDNIRKSLQHIEFRSGRPVLEDLIRDDLAGAVGQNVAVLSCAHNRISDDVRRIVATEVTKFDGRLDLLEELQTW